MSTFANISQRVVFSYQRQLAEFAPVMPASLSLETHEAIQASQKALHDFFRAFYTQAYEYPECFGLPLKEDVYVVEGDGKEKKADVMKAIRKPRVTMAYGIDFLYFIGQQGELVEGQLRLGQEDYAAFFAKSPRLKKKFIKGMVEAGLVVTEQNETVTVSNTQYPDMMPALKVLAEACAQCDRENLAKFLFARCDFRALDVDYRPDALDVLQTALASPEYKHIIALHYDLVEMAYEPTAKIDGVFGWKIQYQGNRKIKASPFFEFEYDERLERPLIMRVKCASTNRLVPFIAQQSASLQEDFYQHTHTCGGCGWCKTRKGMGPSVLAFGGEKKTICWYMQRGFNDVNGEVVNLVKQYAALHEALATA